jgi:MFS family permease
VTRGSKTTGVRLDYRGYFVVLLAAILTLNGLDSVAIGVVLPDIKLALHLSDSELGFLTGIAFFLFYSTIGVPIARWADRGNRVAIIAIATGLWSIMVMLVGVAGTFGQLLLIRIGVAIGESGCAPASYSLISDLFSRDERPRAMGNYLLGVPLSVILGYILAGLLSHWYGWRIMFVVLGLPGIVVAPIAWWTLVEPRTSAKGRPAEDLGGTETPGIIEVGVLLWKNTTFRRILSMTCTTAFFGSGIMTWQPSFYMRSYGFSAEELGFILAAINGICGLAGTYLGGWLAGRYARSNEALQLRALAVLNGAFGVNMALAYLTHNAYLSFALAALGQFGLGLETGPLYSALQTVVPDRMRAVAASIQYLFANLIGAGFGPLVVGIISDALSGSCGKESLRYALVVMSPGFFWGARQLWRAARTVSGDMVKPERSVDSMQAGRSTV